MTDRPQSEPRPRCLDLFCGAGGASMGLHRAGFDVVGVDIKKQPRYPFPFIQGDALRPPVRLEDFDLVWASPPCQAHSSMKNMKNRRIHRSVLLETRELLLRSGRHWVCENVPGAPMPLAFRLCGSSLGLSVRRHRLFEASFMVMVPQCQHRQAGEVVTVLSRGGGGSRRKKARPLCERMRAMGMDWVDDYGLSQAIPPAYSEHIGKYALMALNLEPEALARAN